MTAACRWPSTSAAHGRGVHKVHISPDSSATSSRQARAASTIAAAALDATPRRDVAPGELITPIRNRSVLPVGHTFVKGVDLLDGHLVQSAPRPRGPGPPPGPGRDAHVLERRPQPRGPDGRGLGFNYGSLLHSVDCGLVTVVHRRRQQPGLPRRPTAATPSSRRRATTRGWFRTADGSYDFFDKAGDRHHFREPEDPTQPHGVAPAGVHRGAARGPHRPHLRRPQAEEGGGGPSRVGRGPRAGDRVRPEAAGHDRVSSVSVPALRLRVDYTYHAEWGNLSRVERSGQNLPGARAPRRWRGTTSTRTTIPPTATTSSRCAAPTRATGWTTSSTLLATRSWARTPGCWSSARTSTSRGSGSIAETAGSPPPSSSTTTARRWPPRGSSCRVTDANSHPTRYVLTATARRWRSDEPLGKSTFTTWATDDILKLQEKDALERITDFGYDERGEPYLGAHRHRRPWRGGDALPVRSGLQQAHLQEGRGGAGDLLTRSTPRHGDLLSTRTRSATSLYVYDDHGQLQRSRTRASTSPSTTRTTASARRGTITDPLGNVTTREYDDRGRLTRRPTPRPREHRRPTTASTASGRSPAWRAGIRTTR